MPALGQLVVEPLHEPLDARAADRQPQLRNRLPEQADRARRSQSMAVRHAGRGASARTEPAKKNAANGARGVFQRNRRRQAGCASGSTSSSGAGAHTYAENRGVLSGSQPREITMPTGSCRSGVGLVVLHMMSMRGISGKKKPPERSGASPH